MYEESVPQPSNPTAWESGKDFLLAPSYASCRHYYTSLLRLPCCKMSKLLTASLLIHAMLTLWGDLIDDWLPPLPSFLPFLGRGDTRKDDKNATSEDKLFPNEDADHSDGGGLIPIFQRFALYVCIIASRLESRGPNAYICVWVLFVINFSPPFPS